MKRQVLTLLCLFLLTGCNSLRQELVLEYKVSRGSLPSESFKERPGGFELALNLQSVNCDSEKLKAQIARSADTFFVTINDFDSAGRCSQSIEATVNGVPKGAYTVVVSYQSSEGEKELMRRQALIPE